MESGDQEARREVRPALNKAERRATPTMSSLQLPPTAEIERAKRSAAIGGTAVAVVTALLAIVGSAILIGLSLFVILLGIIFSLTVVGLVIGVPLIVVGVLGLIGGIIGGSGGVFFALLLGAGTGYGYYRYRLRRLARSGTLGAL
jgi:uncharacterized membrane protein